MIDAVIPTKDRAMQLRLLLESIAKNCHHLFENIYLIVSGSDRDYLRGYAQIQTELSDVYSPLSVLRHKIKWVIENDSLVHTMLEVFNTSSAELICGFTDDCVVFKPIEEQVSGFEYVFNDPKIFTFALRMGLNTIVQNYITGERQPPLTDYYSIGGEIITWEWRGNMSYNYHYPWTMDGHIYRRAELIDLTQKTNMSCLRTWEGSGLAVVNALAPPRMASFRDSVMICLANNCVQDPPMISGTYYPYSPKELNQRYIDGEVIDFSRLDFSNVLSCHDEKPFIFTRN